MKTQAAYLTSLGRQRIFKAHEFQLGCWIFGTSASFLCEEIFTISLSGWLSR